MHHDTVHRVLSQAGIPKPERSQRSSIIDDYLPFIIKTLEQYPQLCASRLYAMVKERDYPGGPDHFRHLIAQHRPRKTPEAFLRLKTLPGEQAQVDWGHFGTLTIGQAKRPLNGLCYGLKLESTNLFALLSQSTDGQFSTRS